MRTIKIYSSIGRLKSHIPKMELAGNSHILSLTEIISHGIENINEPIAVNG
jgi:hypothetical protein